MKKRKVERCSDQQSHRRILSRGLQLTFMLLFAVFYANADNNGLENQKLNLNCRNQTIKEVLSKIEAQTGYYFLYNSEMIDVSKTVNFSVHNEDVQQTLNKLFAGKNIQAVIKDKHIILKSPGTILQDPKKMIRVAGKVSDTSGGPLPGVTVAIKGESNGTITDADGTYVFSKLASDAVLVFSFVGMEKQEIPVNGRSVINVKMKQSAIGLDEVVAIGYGVVKKKDLTGAVASVGGEDLAQTPVSDVTEALQGRLAGVSVTSEDGRPGADVSIRIRGGGSITQSNDPLFIVDGYPVSSISDVPADQIQSVDVLKDASSTAIYGSRGANGVILITTKSAKTGETKVTYSGYVQVKDVARSPETLNAEQYILHTWSYATAYGSSYASGIAEYFGLGSDNGNHYYDYANVKAHNYTDDVLRTALTHSHNITISGGNENTKIYAGLGYVSDTGIRINSGYKRANANIKLKQKIGDKLKFNMEVFYNETKLHGKISTTNGKGSLVSSAYWYKPIDDPLGDVDYSDVSSSFGNGDQNIDDDLNPVGLIKDVIDKSDNQKLRGYTSLDWDVVKGLTAHGELGMTRNNKTSNYYENGLTNGYKYGKIVRSTGKGFRSLATLNYQLKLGESSNFSFLAGNEFLKSSSESTTVIGKGYPDSYDYDKVMGLIQNASTSTSFENSISTPSHSVSFFGRANYSLEDRYLFTATFRADGSSKFATNNRWGYFPAFAFGWRLSDEPMMAGATWMDNLKLRLSYGQAGSDNIDSDLWHETWESGSSDDIHYPVDGELGTYYSPEGLKENSDLKWETTISRNFGIDYGFWNGLLFGSLEVYWNTTKDLLMAVPIDTTTGYSYQYQNFGQTSNKGLEISVGSDIIKSRDFSLTVNLIYNYNRNKIDKLEDTDDYQYGSRWASTATQPTYDYALEEGKAVGLIRGYKSEGFYKVSDFNYSNGVYTLKDGVPDFDSSFTGNYPSPFTVADGQSAFPGALKLKDADGDGEVTSDDYVDLGEARARHTGSVNLAVRYKHFDLGANFNWVLGGKIYNAASLVSSYGNKDASIGANRLAFVGEAYKVYNVDDNGDLYAVTDPDELESLNANAKYALPYYENGITYSTFVENGSYLKLKTLTLGYNLPTLVTHRLGIQSARIYVTGTNLFTITGYSGVDPEVDSSQTSNSSYFSDLDIFPTTNMDWGAYPRSRTYTFGVNVTF